MLGKQLRNQHILTAPLGRHTTDSSLTTPYLLHIDP